MRIGEAAKETGLSVSNIRFYEKKGLLAPAREAESRYRDYTEEDISDLKRIMLYRKMNLSVEMIYLLKQGGVSFGDVLRRQMEDLKEQQEMLQGSIDLCERILKEPDPERIDVEYYLHYVEEEEARGQKFALVEELLDDASDFCGISKFRGDPLVGKFLINPWAARGIAALWLLTCIVLPIVEIGDKILSEGSVPPLTVLFWGMWFALMTYSFYQFRKYRARERAKK